MIHYIIFPCGLELVLIQQILIGFKAILVNAFNSIIWLRLSSPSPLRGWTNTTFIILTDFMFFGENAQECRVLSFNNFQVTMPDLCTSTMLRKCISGLWTGAQTRLTPVLKVSISLVINLILYGE